MRILFIKFNEEVDIMDSKEIIEKAKKVVKKVNKKVWVAGGAVLIVGIAVLLNVLFVPDSLNDKNGVIDPVIDLTDVAASVDKVDNSEVADALAEMTLSRRQARDEAIEVLQSVANSSTATESDKQVAAAEIASIACSIENEANIESLIMAKGFEKCVAVVSDDSASVVVKCDGLEQNQIAQISEIVYEQAGILPSNLNIIETE